MDDDIEAPLTEVVGEPTRNAFDTKVAAFAVAPLGPQLFGGVVERVELRIEGVDALELELAAIGKPKGGV